MSHDSGDDWFIPQKVPLENITLLKDSPKYGFANKISEALTAFEVCFDNFFFFTKTNF